MLRFVIMMVILMTKKKEQFRCDMCIHYKLKFRGGWYYDTYYQYCTYHKDTLDKGLYKSKHCKHYEWSKISKKDKMKKLKEFYLKQHCNKDCCILYEGFNCYHNCFANKMRLNKIFKINQNF